MMLGDTTEFTEPLPDETVSILTGNGMGVTDDKVVGVVDSHVAAHSVMFLDFIGDVVLNHATDHAAIAVLDDLFINILKNLSDKEANSSVAKTGE